MYSDTASTSSRLTIPISPTFSTDTVSSAPQSEATSDEQPDLGAFTTVLWAWNHLQPPPRMPIPQFHSPPSSSSRTSRLDTSSVSSFTHPGLSEASGTESPLPPETVWTQHQLQSYFNINSITPSSGQVQELEDDEYEINLDNDNPGAGYRDSPPPPSPLSDGSRTVEIYEAASDIEIQDTASFNEESVSLDRSIAGGDMAVPVTVFSPNQDASIGLHSSDEGDNSSLTSRELPLRMANSENHPYPSYSFHRSSSHQFPTHRNRSAASSDAFEVQITPQRSEFPIHDRSSVYSQSTSSRTVGSRNQRSLWTPPTHQSRESPHNVAVDDSSSVYSYHTRDESESAVRSLLDQARARSLVDDNSNFARSAVDDSDASSTMSRDDSIAQDPSLPRTPDSTTHSLTSHSHSSQSSSPSMSLLSQRRPSSSSIHYGPGSSNNNQREPDVGQKLKGSPFLPPSGIFPYSPLRRPMVYNGGDEDDESHTPTRNMIRQPAQQVQNFEPPSFMESMFGHPHSHALLGHHLLPTTLESPQQEPEDSTAEFADEEQLSEYSEGELDEDQPSLGLLDEALSFIAAERAKREAGRESGVHLPDAAFTPREWQHVVEPKRKRGKRKSARKKSPPSPSISTPSATRPLLLAANNDEDLREEYETGLITPPATLMPTSPMKDINDDQDNLLTRRTSTKLMDTSSEKRITILSRPKPTVEDASITHSIEEPLILTGKKGNRVGRKERERAKARKDKERAALLQPSEPKGQREDWDADNDDVDDEDWAEGDVGFSSSSAADNVARSRGSAGSLAYIHHPLGKGAYKSTPGTPGHLSPVRLDREDDETVIARGDENDSEQERIHVIAPAAKGNRSRKKTRTKRPSKSLVHSKSYPNIRSTVGLDRKDDSLKRKKALLNVSFDLEDDDSDDMPEAALLDQSKRSRLLGLAAKLQTLFPEQKKDLLRVVRRLENVGKKENYATSGSDKPASSASGKRRKGHVRNGSSKGGGSGSFTALPVLGQEDIAFEEEQDPAELVITGPSPADDGPLIHVFIDLSNILIGLLNFLKRSPPPQSVISEYMAVRDAAASNVENGVTTVSPVKAIPVPESISSSSSKSPKRKAARAIPIAEYSPSDIRNHEYPIPLPSFATAKKGVNSTKTRQQDVALLLSKSLPTESVLDAHMAKRSAKKNRHTSAASDGNEDAAGPVLQENAGGGLVPEKKAKKFPRHLWHAAFVLVLERGRAVSRRVVVTSSPLYQPMEKIQNLGYEVRVYIRVPDLGDGMDRERHKDKDTKNSTTRATYGAKGLSSSSSSQAPPASAPKKTHIRHISGSTSAESGSAGSARPGAAVHNNLGSAVSTNSASAAVAGAGNNSGTTQSIAKIRYREQGVDELLQLKLHQAIADADAVPKGSTIVLATGDGNVGQFNEDGFLGPVRTALKRGWRVELYAWEDGLSRSWRREFGENSEWGRKGFFQIIPLEQFATSLVEASGW